MLVIPLYGICAISLISVFFPWIKALQEPSIALLQSASAVSRDCFKEFGGWLQLSTGDAGRPASPLFSPPLIVYLPTPTASIVSSQTQSWNGPNDYMLIPTDSSLATVPQSENSLSLVTPFKVYPARFPPPVPAFGNGSAVNDAGENFAEGPIISNDGLPLFLGLVASILASFHLVVYISWKRDMARYQTQAAEEKVTTKPMEDLSKARIVLDKKDSYLKGVLEGLETTSKQRQGTSSDAQIEILERLYTERNSSTTPKKLVSIERGTIPRSDFESTYGAVPRVPDPSTVVPQFPVEQPSERTESKSDIGNQRVRDPAAANDAQPALRAPHNGGRPTVIQATRRPSTVVPHFHVERPSVPQRPFVRKSVRPPQRAPRPYVKRLASSPVKVDIHAGGTPDTNSSLRWRQHVPSSSTTVDIRAESPPEPVMSSSVTDCEKVEPSTMVDIHAEGAPVAKFTGAGSQPGISTVASRTDKEDGYDSSTSVQTAFFAPTTPSAATATATATAGVEVEAPPQTEQPSRRRKNRMGQRQRRRLREMRENRGGGSPQLQLQLQGEEEE